MLLFVHIRTYRQVTVTFDVSLSIILLLLKKTEMSRSIRFSVHLKPELSIKFSKSHNG